MMIRRFRLEDLTDVMEFSKRAYGYQEEDRHLDDLRILTECCARGYVEEPEGMFVAVEDGKVVGTCFAFSKLGGPDEGVVDWVGVAPEVQGTGIGKKLMEAAEAYLDRKGVKRAVLDTDRPKAVGFYVRRGYGIVNCRMMKRFLDHCEEQGSSKNQQLVRLIEDYASFRVTHHNIDELSSYINAILESPTSMDKKAVDLTKLANDYRMHATTAEETSTTKREIEAILEN